MSRATNSSVFSSPQGVPSQRFPSHCREQMISMSPTTSASGVFRLEKTSIVAVFSTLSAPTTKGVCLNFGVPCLPPISTHYIHERTPSLSVQPAIPQRTQSSMDLRASQSQTLVCTRSTADPSPLPTSRLCLTTLTIPVSRLNLTSIVATQIAPTPPRVSTTNSGMPPLDRSTHTTFPKPPHWTPSSSVRPRAPIAIWTYAHPGLKHQPSYAAGAFANYPRKQQRVIQHPINLYRR
ncbi:hypothetical protein DFS34DRAFT_676521 [Phlyctochytrium arcticum]|nr:hypothetical protein DFS34DRAFT_676521 [Phlyctochytrium arcticum]